MGWNRLRSEETNVSQPGIGWLPNEHHQSNAGPRRWAVARGIRSVAVDKRYHRNCCSSSCNHPSNFSGSPEYNDGSLILGRGPEREVPKSSGSGLDRVGTADDEDRWAANCVCSCCTCACSCISACCSRVSWGCDWSGIDGGSGWFLSPMIRNESKPNVTGSPVWGIRV
jgi:hypothetical protein